MDALCKIHSKRAAALYLAAAALQSGRGVKDVIFGTELITATFASREVIKERRGGAGTREAR